MAINEYSVPNWILAQETMLKQRVKALGHELLTDNSEPGEGEEGPMYYLVDRILGKIVLSQVDAEDVEKWVSEYGEVLELMERRPDGKQIVAAAYESGRADPALIVEQLKRPRLLSA